MGSSITHSHTLEVGLDKISFMISITAISLQLVDLLKSLFSVSGKNLEAMICPFENVAFAVIEKFWQNSLNTFYHLPQVTQLAGYFEPLIMASVGVASKLKDHQQQMTFLDQTKTLAESALQMLYAAKEGGGNRKV